MRCDEDEATEVAALQGSHIHITTAFEYISITVIVIVKAKTPSYIKCPRQSRSWSGEVMRILYHQMASFLFFLRQLTPVGFSWNWREG
jgi:hypothetical protein